MRAFLKMIGRSWMTPAFVLVLVVLMISCSDQQLGLEPIPSTSGAVVTGVLSAGDEVVEGATVRLEPVYGGLPISVSMAIDRAGGIPVSPMEYAPDIRVTVSDAGGRFCFGGLDTGTYLIETQAKDHLAGSAQARITPELAAAAETTFVDIDLVPTGTFTGNVTLQNSYNHSSTVVYVTGSSNVAVTNEAGEYELRHVPVGEHTIQATHTGWIDDSISDELIAAGDSVHLESFMLLRESNMAPEVSIAPLPQFPVANIFDDIEFTASAVDPDGSIVLVEWDFTDDGAFDLEGDATILSTTYAPPDTGTFRAKIRVTDDDGAIGLAVLNYYVNDAIYVWGEEGDNANPGTASQPVQTITQGIALAELTGQPVVVHTGSYWEDLEFKSNVSIYGGYDRSDGWYRAPGQYSQVWLQSYYEHVAIADNVSNAYITGLEIEAETAQGDASNSIALKIISCDSTLYFDDCRIIAGDATAALTGAADGTPGITGGPGANGWDGCDKENDPGCTINAAEGGAGGLGVVEGGYGGWGGFYFFFMTGVLENGQDGLGPWGGTGGPSLNTCMDYAQNGTNAGPGYNGMDGSNATPVGTSYGYISGNDWIGNYGAYGLEGQDGQEGSGGGGGGALWAYETCHVLGGGGGGGGGAGGRGGGGVGGHYGGASIAVLCISSSPVFDSCYISTGNGGNGWRGGDGGAGGTGGAPGLGGDGVWVAGYKSGDGGDGSQGGSGGSGGGGQGGPGGPSIGIYNYNGSSPTLFGITWSIGSGGSGGPGGWHGSGSTQAASGPAGPAQNTYDQP